MSSPSLPSAGPAILDEATAAPVREMRGAQAGAIVFAGILAVNAGNTLFHFLTARLLGPSRYGEVVSLLALAGLIALPLGGVQLAVARAVSVDTARGRRNAAAAIFTWSLGAATAVGTGLALVLLALAPLVRDWLEVDGLSAVALTAAMTVPAVATPVLWGVAQGMQRFALLSASMVVGAVVRVGVLVVLGIAGLTVSGVLGASLVGGLATIAVPLVVLRDRFRVRPRPARRELAELERTLGPVLVGTLAITALTSVDVLVAKAALSGPDAGVYGGASLIGRMILYLPSAIVTVLLPKVSARTAEQRSTRGITSASLAVTGAFALAATAVLALAPRLVVAASLGDRFDRSGPLLWMFGLAMTGYALLNVLLAYHLGRGDTRIVRLLGAGAVVQAAAYVALHDSPRTIVWVSVAVAAALLVLHEALIERSLTSAAAWLLRAAHARRAAWAPPLRRAAALTVLFSAVTALWALPVVTHLDSRVLLRPADGTGTIRDYWAADRQAGSIFSMERDFLVGAPEGTPRSPALQVANGIQPAVVLSLGQLVGRVAAWNLFILAGLVLTALTTFLLLARLGLHPLAAFFGSYAFAFSPFAFEKALVGHAALMHLWVYPLLLLALLRWQRLRDAGSTVPVGLTLAVAFYLHSYAGFIALFMAAVFLAVDLAGRRGARARLRTLASAPLAGLALLVALIPAAVASFFDRGALGESISRTVGDTETLGKRLRSYLLPSDHNPLFGGLVDRIWTPPRIGEPTLFVGYSTMVLAGIGLVLALRSRRPLGAFLGILAAAAFLVSLPRLMQLGPVTVPSPSYLLVAAFHTLRVYARFGLLVGLALAVLAAFAVDALVRRRGPLVGVALLAVLAVETAPGLPVPTWDAGRPEPYAAWLRDHPGGIVATFPTPAAGSSTEVMDLAAEDLYEQVFHGHPLYTLAAGSGGQTREDAIRILSRDPLSLDGPGVMKAEGVRYVVLHDDVYRELGQEPPNPPPPDYEQLAAFPGVRIFALHSKPRDVAATLAENRAAIAAVEGPPPSVRYGVNFYEPTRYKNRGLWRWMWQNARLEVDVKQAGEFQIVANAFSMRVARTLTISIRSGRRLARTTVPTYEQRFVLGPFRLPEGHSTLELQVTPEPEPFGGDDPRSASIYLSPIAVQLLADLSHTLAEPP